MGRPGSAQLQADGKGREQTLALPVGPTLPPPSVKAITERTWDQSDKQFIFKTLRNTLVSGDPQQRQSLRVLRGHLDEHFFREMEKHLFLRGGWEHASRGPARQSANVGQHWLA